MNEPMAHGRSAANGLDAELSQFGASLSDEAWLGRLREAVRPADLGRLGPFELIAEAARGAQGIVYRARDSRSGRIVALKRLGSGRFATPRQQRRFEREMEATLGLRHPHIVAIHEFDVIDGQPVLAMEWVDGTRIDRWAWPGIGGQRRDLPDVLAAFRAICDAVHHAHQRGVIHRDLKPGNILVDAECRPHVFDFGLAVLQAEGPAAERFTATSEFVGTPAYAAPEQVRGDHDMIDVRTDVYSLGILLYEMLAGRVPFTEEGGLAGLFDAIRNQEPAPPSRCASDIARDLDAIVLKAIAKDSGQRYQSVEALAADVRRFEAGEPVEARRGQRGYVVRRLVRRYRVPLALALAATLLAAGWGVTATVMYARQTRLLADVTTARTESERVQAVLQRLLMGVSEIGKGAQLELRREVLDRAARSAEADLRDSPAAWAAAQDAIGRTYQQLGLYEEAEHWLRASLQARVALYGRENADVAASLSHLAAVLRDRASGAKAEPLFREALDLRRRLFGEEHPQVALSLYDLAMVLQFRADYAAAANLHRRALDMQRRLLGPNHPDVALSLTGLGYACFNLRDLASAEAWFRAALDLRLQLHSEENRDTAGAQVDLGKVYCEQGRLDEAEPLLRQALATFRHLLGDDHDNTAWAAHRLGVVLTARGEIGEAERLLREALATYRRTLGAETAYVGFALESLADLLAKTSRVSEARAALLEAECIFSAQPHQEIERRRVRARLNELGECLPNDAHE